MHTLTPICVISLIILCLLLYLNLSNLKDNYQDSNNSKNKLDDTDKENNNQDEEKLVSIEDIYVALNKLQYNKYMQLKKNNVGNQDFGYSVLPGTNPESLGFCPLGHYYDGKFSGNSKDVRTKCKPCFNCQSKLGYYVSGGCLGDKDVECKFGKVPYDIFIKSHSQGNLLHTQLPLYHQHNYKVDDNTLQSSITHTHV